MNPLIENELKNTKVANVPNYETTTKEIVILKGTKDIDDISFEVGKYYQIVLDSRLTNPNDTLWDNDIVPKDNVMNVEVLEIIGNMIKVHGVGVNSTNTWVGWLPINDVKIDNLL